MPRNLRPDQLESLDLPYVGVKAPAPVLLGQHGKVEAVHANEGGLVRAVDREHVARGGIHADGVTVQRRRRTGSAGPQTPRVSRPWGQAGFAYQIAACHDMMWNDSE